MSETVAIVEKSAHRLAFQRFPVLLDHSVIDREAP
jgi:hypothetical protein